MDTSPTDSIEIEEAIERQLGFERRNSDAWLHLAWKMIESKRPDLAMICFRETVRLNPTVVEAWANLGSLYRRGGQLELSAESFQEAVKLQPNNVSLIKATAATLRQAGVRTEARSLCESGLRLEPESIELRLLLGNILQELDEFESAIEYLEDSIQRAGRTEQNVSCLGIAWFRKGDVERAIALFRESIAINPHFADGHFHLGMALLLNEEYKNGWNEYEWRPGGRRRPVSQSTIPLWDGRPLSVKQSLLLAAEQGFGDTIQFMRFAAEVKRRNGCRIIVQAQRPLIPLLSTCAGVDRWIARDERLPSIDAYLPLASLPSILQFDPENSVPQAQYLFANAQRMHVWKNFFTSEFKSNLSNISSAIGTKRMDSTSIRKIGLAWQGDPKFPADHCRSIPLSYLLPLLNTPHTTWISLQKGYGSEQLQGLDGSITILDLRERLDEDGQAFLDTASIMKQLDLVITSDTAIAHLAGALGVPVWIVLAYVPDWRWNLQRSDSVWYPTARLFRQPKLGDWKSAVSNMQMELAR